MSFEDIIEDSFQFDDDGDERGSEDDEEVSLKLMPGPRPDVEIDEDYFKSLCSADGGDRESRETFWRLTFVLSIAHAC